MRVYSTYLDTHSCSDNARFEPHYSLHGYQPTRSLRIRTQKAVMESALLWIYVELRFIVGVVFCKSLGDCCRGWYRVWDTIIFDPALKVHGSGNLEYCVFNSL